MYNSSQLPESGYSQTGGQRRGAEVTQSPESLSLLSWLWELNELPTPPALCVKGIGPSPHPTDQKPPN